VLSSVVSVIVYELECYVFVCVVILFTIAANGLFYS